MSVVTLQERVHSTRPPSNWSLTKLHHVFSVRRRNKNVGMQENNLLSLSYGRIKRKDIAGADGLLPESFETYQIVEPGDVVLRLTDLQNDKRSLRQGLVTERGIVTSAYDAVTVGLEHEPRFWFYALSALDLAKYYYSMGGGVRQSINFSDFPNDWIGAPDLPTQKAIAAFLDRETARIDQLIEKKQRLVELLGEKRKAAIGRRVFGFQIEEGRKETSVPWMPELPETWKVQRLAQLFDNFDYKRIPLNSEDRAGREKLFPYYGASGVIDEVDDYLFDQDHILVGEDGANLVLQSTPVAFIATGRYWVNNHAHIIHPRSGPLQYWVAALNQVPYELYVTGSAQPKLTAQALGNIPLPVPPVDDQRRIAAEISDDCATIDSVLPPIRSSIDRLKEYRSALITAAVTGQIDVETWSRRGEGDRRLDRIEEEMAG